MTCAGLLRVLLTQIAVCVLRAACPVDAARHLGKHF